MKNAQEIAHEWQKQMNDSRVKCPNCGSTAQIEMVWKDNANYNTEETKEYICGCGCHFEATFTLTKTKIIEN